jgi:methylmalonyl-CoA mutase N-terminal domain/subunit
MQALIDEFKVFKAERSQAEVQAALGALARSANDVSDNVFGRVVEAAQAGCTHGEICHTLRREMGFGDVQAVV